MEWFIIVLLLILLGAAVFGCINMLKKNEKLEERVLLLQNFIGEFSNSLSTIDSQLTEIDNRGVFAADDEVGFAFKTIKLVISQLQVFNVNYVDKKEE